MIPSLKDWKELLQGDLETVGNKKDDLLKVISLCEGYSKDIHSAMDFISVNQAFIDQIKSQYEALYQLRFPDIELEQRKQATGNLLIPLDTPAKRKKQVVEVLRQLAIQPGATVEAKDVIVALEKSGFTLKGTNPNAIVSTILYRLRSDCEKVGGGVFRKKPAGSLFTP